MVNAQWAFLTAAGSAKQTTFALVTVKPAGQKGKSNGEDMKLARGAKTEALNLSTAI